MHKSSLEEGKMAVHLQFYIFQDQKELPKELFPVKMYCLVTEKPQKAGRVLRKRKQSRRPAIIKS
jgi:AdoMet dependent proline di-methyltransferase